MHKDGEDKDITKIKDSRLTAPLGLGALIAFAALAGMFAFQVIKHFLLPEVTIWQSHMITNIFGAGGAGVAAYFMFKRYRALSKQIVAEMTKREETDSALQRRSDELALVNRAGQAFNSTLDLDEVLVTILEETRQLLDVSGAMVWLVEPETGGVSCRQISGGQSETVRSCQLRLGETVARQAIDDRTSIIIADTRETELQLEEFAEQLDLEIRSILSVPLRSKQSAIGVLQVVDTKAARFVPSDVTFLESLAAFAADAIENARLYEQAQSEINERRQAEETLHQRDYLLQGVARAINYLLTTTDYTLAIDRAIETLGLATGVNQVGIFENYYHLPSGDRAVKLRFEWLRHMDAAPQAAAELPRASYDTLFPHWYQKLTSGDPVVGLAREFPPAERATLDRLGLLSVLIVPMMIGKQCWGFISFGDQYNERAWSEGEITVLTTAAGSIGGAIMRQQAEQALRESEERYRTLFDQAQESIILENTAEQILDANRAACQLCGYNYETLLTMKTSDLVLLDTTSRSKSSAYANPLQFSGELLETTIMRHDGTQVPVELTITPLHAGGQTLFLSIIRDITVRKQIEEGIRQRSREFALLNHAAQAFNSTLNLDQVLITVLDEVRSLMGVVGATVWLTDPESGGLVCRQASGLGSNVVRGWHLKPGEGLAGWTAARGESLIVSDTQADRRHFKGVDSQIGLELRSILSVPLKVKESVVGVLHVVDTEVNRFTPRDLTLFESLTASAAIAIENARLYQQAQQEIAERKRAEETLQQRTVELQARNEELDTFAHTVAHDLKNPASFITGFAKLLSTRYAGLADGNQELQEALRHIAQAGTKMNNIIEELMLLAGLRKMKVETAPLDMRHIVDEAIQRVADIIEREKAEIILPDSWLMARGYGPWVEEVWVNYLSNAIKYGGHPPRVELGAEAQANGMIRFWVRDNGSGISREDQGRLFAPFMRLDQVHAQGHGLGLSIVKRIMEKLEGQVGIESAEAQGSTFFFTLPSVMRQSDAAEQKDREA